MMPSGQVLYYPYTHFRSSAWLKTAALYYEGITRIIPEQFSPRDSTDVNVLTEAGFLHQVDPRSGAEAIASDFINYLNHYLRDNAQRDRLFPELAASGASFRIQPGKMAAAVREALLDIHPESWLPENGDDFDLDPVTGGIYMAFLAKRMATELSVPVVTHEPVFQRLIYKPLELSESTKDDVAEPTFALASLVIEAALPVYPDSIPVDSIVRFRTKHRDARNEFFDSINAMGAEIDLSEGPKALNDFLTKKQAQIDKKVRDLRTAMADVGIGTIQNFIYCSVPSWLVGKWGLGMDTGHLVLGTAAVSAAFSLYRGYRELEKLRRENPWAYVLSLEKLNSPHQLLNRNEAIKLF